MALASVSARGMCKPTQMQMENFHSRKREVDYNGVIFFSVDEWKNFRWDGWRNEDTVWLRDKYLIAVVNIGA